MSTAIDQVLDLIGGMTVLELSELKKKYEDKFGVTAAAPMMAMPMGGMPGGGAAAVTPNLSSNFFFSSASSSTVMLPIKSSTWSIEVAMAPFSFGSGIAGFHS